MSDTTWTPADIPDQTGRVAVVTGANSGLGYHTALELARAGARVVLACRTRRKGDEAAARIRAAAPAAAVEVRDLDLASLASVEAFADALTTDLDRLDLLVNNAGIMMVPPGLTEDGFERQLGTNHLGHFALTGRLLDLLSATAGSRVVTVSSIAHRDGRIVLDDLMFADRPYDRQVAYQQSKLANLLFHFELLRRLRAAGRADPTPVASHPGVSATNLGDHLMPSWVRWWAKPLLTPVLNSPAAAAEPSLRAATDPAMTGGEYLGPHLWEIRGRAARVEPRSHAHDPAVQEALWARSVELTGVDPGI